MDLHIPSLHERSMLAYISVSAWSARKLDRKTTAKVTSDANSTADGARVNKYLLASADELLRKITKAGADARRYLEANSLPWDDAGNRLISNLKSIEIAGKLGEMGEEFNTMVEQFIAEYPELRARAIENLGELADDEDYPPPDAIRHKFSLRLSLSPLPTGFGDVRTGLVPAQVEALQNHFESRVRTQFQTAMLDAWKRLREDVAAIAERLTLQEDGKRKIYRDTLITNARATCALLQSLNVFDEPELERMRYLVEDKLCKFDADELRENPALSAAVKASADEIMQGLKDILGEE